MRQKLRVSKFTLVEVPDPADLENSGGYFIQPTILDECTVRLRRLAKGDIWARAISTHFLQ